MTNTPKTPDDNDPDPDGADDTSTPDVAPPWLEPTIELPTHADMGPNDKRPSP